jgi:hypothetical protein
VEATAKTVVNLLVLKGGISSSLVEIACVKISA